MIDINLLMIIFSIGGYIYSGIKIYKLIKKGKQEKNRTAKGIAFALFYEPFLIYDGIKYIKRKLEVRS